MPSPTQTQGYLVETQAKRYLLRQGLCYLSNHFYCPYGEIDLIMKDQETLVFVEVRARQNTNFTTAIESISPSKQRKLITTAQFYLQQHDLTDKIDCRFDVIGQDGGEKFYWIKNALEVQY